MSLTGRLSAVFLAVLAAVLAAFSATLYGAAWAHLHRQAADRADAALDVLTAAAEIHPDGVEWEPRERLLPLGRGGGPDQLRWAVLDDRGRPVDRSVNLPDADLPAPRATTGRLDDRHGRPWLAARRRVRPGGLGGTGSRAAAERTDPVVMDPPVLFYPALDMVAYAPLGPARATLRGLAWLLAGVGSGSWVAAALLCRRASRHALAPLRRLAESARGLDATDPGWSLEPAGTGDELDELGRAFNDLLVRLHHGYERQRAFSGHASHQLRTPLTILVGQIEVALRRERSGDEYRRVLATALGRAVQLGQVVEALLFLAEGEADRADAGVGAAILDLDAWAAAHLAGLHAAGRFARAEHRPAGGGPLPVRAASTLLGQLLDNLLDNAAKHGGPDGAIVVTTAREAGRAVLAVQDAGPGIAAADAPHVFDPFYRAATSRARGVPGAGLGLAVVRRIARASGGEVTIAGGPGGCRVEVRLPLAAIPAPAQ